MANVLAEVLLVEDNPADIEMTMRAFEKARFRNKIHSVRDGDEALDFLYKRGGYEDAVTPDIILLDLNMPKTDGKEVLADIKAHTELKRIPVIIMTSSESDQDVLQSYDLHANCYIVKPVDARKFFDIVNRVENFWVDIVVLPSKVEQ
ncbi:response regulator [Halioxenophilus aromaticivorans]|uniref:Response regulator n=1 Tax=Halioxenophilus aromaticivorans TaxID=1306992 RepID=A0AAV3U4Q9_9ALTE